jgi:hypothetical protein
MSSIIHEGKCHGIITKLNNLYHCLMYDDNEENYFLNLETLHKQWSFTSKFSESST